MLLNAKFVGSFRSIEFFFYKFETIQQMSYYIIRNYDINGLPFFYISDDVSDETDSVFSLELTDDFAEVK